MTTPSITRGHSVTNLRRVLPAVLTVLIAASALSLATAGPAAAGVGNGVPITLNSQWWSGNAGFATIPPTAYIDESRLVHLWGAAKQIPACGLHGCVIRTADPNLLGTLPEGPYAPQRNVFAIVHTNLGTYADVEIRTNGQIWLIDPRPPAVKDYAFVSLEGVSYDPLNPSDSLHSPGLIHLNSPWSPDATFNTAIPAAYYDGDAGVHLEGAVTWPTNQPQPTGPTVIGTLPPGDEPPYNAYEIVHTNFGTYADVEITGKITAEINPGAPPPGQIILIPPARRPPRTTRSCRSRASAGS